MTMTYRIAKTCFVCKNESRQAMIASTSVFGPPDLDTRPAEHQRSTMRHWIEICPHCGYAATDISKETSVTRAILESRNYKECGGVALLSPLAQNFYRQCLLADKGEKYKTAFFSMLHAAWACDDEYDLFGAIRCRRLAVMELEKLMALPERDTDNETLLVIKADLLRRSYDFAAVLSEYTNMTFEKEIHRKIIDFQLDRARAEDANRYTVSQITAQ